MENQLQHVQQEGLNVHSQEYNIELKNLCYSVYEKKGKQKCTKPILQNINGKFRSGQLTAILGPSGAGKSTLLNILSGFRKSSTPGAISINGKEHNVQEMKRITRYITQEFAMLPLLTTRETLMTAANLKLSNDIGTWEKSTTVNEIIDLLGLSKVIHTSVGKLSGGEKKRLSIGVELLTNPPIMFFDEPTSGLDSSSSYQVITHLKSLAKAGRIMVCAIHQPSSRLFEMFDDMLILAEGKCFYNGPIKDMTRHFEEAGFQCPTYYNRADFAIEVVCGERGEDFENLISKVEDKIHIQTIEDMNSPESITEETSILTKTEYRKIRETTVVQISMDKNDKSKRNFPVKAHTQFLILVKRCLLCTMRDLHMTQLRVIAHIAVGLLLGAIYYGMGNEASKMSSNAACIFFFVMFLFFSNAMPTVLTFPVEASVLRREYLNNWYSLPAYYFSKLVAEIPLQILCPTLFTCIAYFLTFQPYDGFRLFQFWVLCLLQTILAQMLGLAFGAVFDAQLGIFLVPASSIPMILFSGFFLKVQDIPHYLHWLSYLSYFRYAFEGAMLCVYGYNRPDLTCSVPFCHFKSPSRILEEFGMEESNYGIDILGLVVWIVGLQIVLYLSLKWRLKCGT